MFAVCSIQHHLSLVNKIADYLSSADRVTLNCCQIIKNVDSLDNLRCFTWGVFVLAIKISASLFNCRTLYIDSVPMCGVNEANTDIEKILASHVR